MQLDYVLRDNGKVPAWPTCFALFGWRLWSDFQRTRLHPVSPPPDSLYLAWSLTRSVIADAILFLLATLCLAR